MKTRLWAVVGLLQIALLFVGCGGEEERPPPAAAVQEREESGASVGETSSEASNESAGEAGGKSGRSGRVEARQCEDSGFAAEAALAAANESEEQGDQGRTHREIEVDDEWEEKLALVAAAREAMVGWYSQLETLTLEASLAGLQDGRCIELGVSTAIRLNPLAAWSVGDYSPWFELLTGLPLAESEKPVLMQDYLSEGEVYSTVTGLGGWGRSFWHYPADHDDGLIDQWFGIRPSQFGSYWRYRDPLECATFEGGAIVEDEYEGEAVWVITCQSQPDSVMPFDGGYPDDNDPVFGVAAVTISQVSGAPMVTEYQRANRDSDGRLYRSSLRIVPTSWNEPIDFPTPAPLVEFGEYQELMQRLRASTDTPERVIDLIERWLDEQDYIQWSVDVWLEIDSAERHGQSRLRESRSQGALERTVLVAEQRSSNAVAWIPGRRLFWNRDGFWVSESDVDGEPVWTSSTPTAHGFSEMSVDELLAERAWIGLELFRDLLDQSEDTVVTPGDGSMDYEVQIEIGVLHPGDRHFDRIAALLKAALSDLERGDVAVLRIDSFVMGLWLNASRFLAPIRRSAGAEFLTDSGTIKLTTLWSIDHLDERAFPMPSP